MGPHSRVWGNSAGQTISVIATGLNYWDGQQWTPSNPSFEVSPDGTAFIASQIQDPTKISAELNTAGAVTVTTPDNVTLSSTPVDGSAAAAPFSDFPGTCGAPLARPTT